MLGGVRGVGHRIDGDEGDADPHHERARPARYNKSVGMVGAITLFGFVVTDNKSYHPMWQSFKQGVLEVIANDFADQARGSPHVLGFAVGRYEYCNQPLNVEDHQFACLRKASYTASKRRLGELKGWLVWRAFDWAFTDGDLLGKGAGLPPNPFLLIHYGVACVVHFSVVYRYFPTCI